MMACGGGKNGSGSHANFAVATSHSVRKTPSAASQGARCRKPAPMRPRRSAPNVPTSTTAATTKAPMPSSWVRDQSPRSSQIRHDRPNAIQPRLARMPMPAPRSQSRLCAGACAPIPPVSDREYVDINALREFGGVGRRLEHGDRLEILRIGLQLALQHLANRMMVVGVVADHALDIFVSGRLRRIGLERF